MKLLKVVAIVGKSGAGKDTLLHEVTQQLPNCNEIISCTTRPPRANEINGVHYNFLTAEDFCKKINCKEMLEYTTFNNWGYGTSIDSLAPNRINVGVFNPEGVRALKKNDNIKEVIISIIASDKIRLMRQLNREPNPNVKEIIRRYSADEEDYEMYKDIFYGSNVLNISNENNTNLTEITNQLIIPFITNAFGEEIANDS